MRSPVYSSSCTVIKSRKEPDLFYMNMQVFEVMPAADVVPDPSAQIFNIWCAVHHIQIPNHPNKHTSS